MSTALTYAYWPLAVLLMAARQGLLLPAIRRTPPGAEAERQSFALHMLLGFAYLLPLLLLTQLGLPRHFVAWHAAACLMARLLLFDVTLNLAAGSEPFYVGSTAASDRLLRRLAPVYPERLGLWVLSAVVSSLIFITFRS